MYEKHFNFFTILLFFLLLKNMYNFDVKDWLWNVEGVDSRLIFNYSLLLH
jgi:hypothetical protein